MKARLAGVLAAALLGLGCVNFGGVIGPDSGNTEVPTDIEFAEDPRPVPLQPDEITEDNARSKAQQLLDEIRHEERAHDGK